MGNDHHHGHHHGHHGHHHGGHQDHSNLQQTYKVTIRPFLH